MYLVLGNNLDRCCRGLVASLRSRNLTVQGLESPFTNGARLSWTMGARSESQLVMEDGHTLTSDQIDGVLVCSRGWVHAEDWRLEDHDYMRSETQAAVLGWLWSLSCPVVGRVPASVWYRPLTPIMFWQPLLAGCGLAAPQALITNVLSESSDFRSRLGGVAIYAPFSTAARYVVTTDKDWTGLAAVQNCVPICLTQPYEETQPVCIVGDRLIWGVGAPAKAAAFESGLRRFAASTGLNFVEFGVANTDGLQVIDVNPQPRLERFNNNAREAITDAIVEVLTGHAPMTAALQTLGVCYGETSADCKQ